MLQKVDFLPHRRRHGDHKHTLPDYEHFNSLVDKANEWLASSVHTKVMNCETVEVQVMPETHKPDLETSVSVNVPYGKCRLRFLRIWVYKDRSLRSPQKLGYLNVIPNITKSGSELDDLLDSQSLSSAVESFNEIWKENPLPGSVLSVVSECQPLTRWPSSINPNDTLLVDGAYVRLSYVLHTLRIFYVEGEPTIPQLGIKDFAPQILSRPKKGPFDLLAGDPVFEPFEKLQRDANEWMHSQDDLQLVSIQAINFRLSSSEQKMLFSKGKTNKMEIKKHRKPLEVLEPLSTKHHFMRLLRVTFNKGDSLHKPSDPVASRCFLPRADSFYSKTKLNLEDQVTNISRISGFWSNPGEKLISVETVRHHLRAPQEQDPCATYWTQSRTKSTSVVTFFRVYLRGEINGSTPENGTSLTLPDASNDSECVIL